MTPRDTKYQPGVCTALLAAVLMLLAVAVMLSGCSPTKYVPVETVRTEYRDREVEKIVADTVHDTRFVWVKGDTLVDIRETEHIRRVEIHDTCYIERTDTIRIPYPVEKHLTKWEQAKQDVGGIAIGVIIAVACIAVVWLIKKFRK
ncbi:hypothetical protein [Paramuribaculum intestinale]|uniref:hypothetical protein n=1 Tax=Paramuribaculum intestinale TaxID=2094151 RepID=UPI0025AA0A2D|nr:hypothetical protein [Paramuribaculum intestinale]